MTDASGGLRCLVFGGTGALGGTVCRLLHAHGERLAFGYHHDEAGAARLLAELPGSVAVRLDLGVAGDVERAVDEASAALGGLDAFVQCAGVALTEERTGPTSHHTMADVTEAGWDLMIDVNVKGTFFAVRRLVPILRASGGGNIVLTGSIDGVKPVPSPVHYAASKGALAGMVSAMAKELGKDRVRVNLVAPGLMAGGISKYVPPELLAEYLRHCGLKRLGKLEEVAAVLAFFATRNTYVTGQTILVDGAL